MKYRLLSLLLLGITLLACAAGESANNQPVDCPTTEPTWLKHPPDTAVSNEPAFGHYFTNQDQSILASAWWTDQPNYSLHASEDGVKMGWFRPAGATLAISGHRLDAQAPPLDARVPCCYPTQFQATGLFFPTEGCWEVVAEAADSRLAFVVEVMP